jgi:thiamine kinase-like enzyme
MVFTPFLSKYEKLKENVDKLLEENKKLRKKLKEKFKKITK